MKPIFVALCFCLVFVPILITVHGSDIEKLKKRLKREEVNINGELQILPGEPLGNGSCGLVYKGNRMYRDGDTTVSRPVAVKFIPFSLEHNARNEYNMYWYLNAIDNPEVEKFGIPAVYYYDKWEKFIVTAVTLCEKSLREIDPLIQIDALNIFHQFVIQSKYLHKHRIYHGDLKPDNILFRNHQTFLIGYNLGSKFGEDTGTCSYKYKPRRMYRGLPRRPIDDWESFFYAMAEMCGVPFEWFSYSDKYKKLSGKELDKKFGEAKKNVDDIRVKIYAIEWLPLKSAFVAVYSAIYSGEDFPDYDRTYVVITHYIQSEFGNQTLFFNWMDSEATEEAKKYIETNGIPDIGEIGDPSRIEFAYTDVNFNYFNGSTTAESSRHHKTKKSHTRNCFPFLRP